MGDEPDRGDATTTRTGSSCCLLEGWRRTGAADTIRGLRGVLTFSKPVDVVPDGERPGLLRAQRVSDHDRGEAHVCDLQDLATPGVAEPGLEEAGFETIDLSCNIALQQALRTVRDADHMSDPAAATIREALTGATFELTGGKRLRVEHVADEGLINRRSGPNGIDVNPGGMDGANGHGGAKHVHGDQDVYGTPLRQMMHGGAPEMFRHITPDGRNDHSDTFLLNLWIPLHAPVQPLALMDRRTLDARRHQLLYGLPVEGFLERDEDESVNDIWTFLHDDDQRWYVCSDMGPDRGYVFDTLGSPHGAAVLPGEEELAALFRSLARACDALQAGQEVAVETLVPQHPAAEPPTGTTATIRDAWRRMSDLVDEAATVLIGQSDADEWVTRARAAMDAVIRRSVEMRLVATLLIDPSPGENA